MKMLQILNRTTRNTYLAKCLFDCIEDKNIPAIKKLLEENGANPNISIPDRGMTPFHFAIGSWDENVAEKITKLILDYGGNPNVRSDEDITPVHVAAAWGRLKVLKILLDNGGDPSFEDMEGKTAIDFAIQENYPNIVEYLQNFIQELDYNTAINSFTFNKIIINNGSVIAEYETRNGENKMFDLDKLPKNNISDYVSNWCLENTPEKCNENMMVPQKNCKNNSNTNVNQIDSRNNLKSSVTYISDDESIGKSYSRESGILTIDGSLENNLAKHLKENDEISSQYMSCQSVNEFDKNIVDSLITLDLSDQKYSKIWSITSDESVRSAKNIPCNRSGLDEDMQYTINIEQECKYTDKEEGIVLIEKRILVNPKIDENRSTSSNSSKISSLPSVINYDTDTLRRELTVIGEPPGPITKTTKRVYLKRLKKLQKCNTILEHPINKTETRVYSVELEKTLRDPNWSKNLTSYKALESVIANQFNKPQPSKRWREGSTKASFTYLLLDPRITLNLPLKSSELPAEEVWRTFLSAIFYVGKGKRSRPYRHLYEAVNYWKSGQKSLETNKKINYILDIWKANFGVVCLHIFQNVIPVEAYTREAAMINALKLQNLCNSKLGDFYGICATWPEKKKRLLGVYLLYRAMLIFLNEGERQLMPDDIGK